MSESPLDVSDQELVCQVKAGKLSAFESLMGRYYARILQFVSRKLSCQHTAQDLTQEVFVVAWQKAGTYKSEYPYIAWLYTIARRRIASWYRRSSRVIDLPETSEVDDRSPMRDLSEREQAEFVWQLAARLLSDDAYLIMWMMYRDDIPLKKVAAALERSESAVKVTVFRARKTLKDHLIRAGQTEDCYGKEVALLVEQLRGGA